MLIVRAVAVVALVGGAAAAQTITLEGGPAGTPPTPMHMTVGHPLVHPDAVRLVGRTAGATVLGKYEWLSGGITVWFIAPKLGPGEKLTLTLEPGSRVMDLDMAKGVRIKEEDGGHTVRINGDVFMRYVTTDTSKPYCYPVIGPTGVGVTRGWPMVTDIAGEANDHVHHQSLWFGFGDVNGHDFWATAADKCRIVPSGPVSFETGLVFASLKASNAWTAQDGTVICTDTRTIRVYDVDGIRMMDYEVTIHASEGPAVFGDTKEGMMSLRLCPELTVDNGAATIVNSQSDKNGDAWGKRARWCDDYGTLGGDTVGVAILDAPTNLRHPTYWHVRTYGLFGANPFGVRDFTSDPASDGSLTIPAGGEQTFKYRIVIHKGTPEEAGIEQLWQAYARDMTQ